MSKLEDSEEGTQARADFIATRINALNSELRELGLRMWRLHTAGNAGGVIATLSFMGTVFSRESQVDRAFFWVLVVFVVGLFFSLLGVSGDIMSRYNERKWLHSPVGEDGNDQLLGNARAANLISFIASLGGAIAVFVGFAAALTLLFGLTV